MPKTNYINNTLDDFGFDSFISDIQKNQQVDAKPAELEKNAEPKPANSRAGETEPKKTAAKSKAKKADAAPEEKPTAHTLSVRHSVWKAAKAKATQNDTTISELIEKYLVKYTNS